MHILIADDEAPARGELRFVLEDLVPEATFYEAANGHQALDVVEAEPVEVVFLDINMPGMDGLAAAATIVDLPDPPLIVFATAYDEHALRAFELAALDYVVKPFDERRLANTVVRIRQALRERAKLAQRQAATRAYLGRVAPAGGLSKLWGQRENESRVLVDYGDILWVEAEDKKVYMRTATGAKLLVRNTLKELQPRLEAHNFARVHKGYLVNLDHVADKARTEIPMSRRYARQLKTLTGW